MRRGVCVGGLCWAGSQGGGGFQTRPGLREGLRPRSTLCLWAPFLPMIHSRGEGDPGTVQWGVEAVTPDSGKVGGEGHGVGRGAPRPHLHRGRRLPSSLGLSLPLWAQIAAWMTSGRWSPVGGAVVPPGVGQAGTSIVLSSVPALPCGPHPSGGELALSWLGVL